MLVNVKAAGDFAEFYFKKGIQSVDDRIAVLMINQGFALHVRSVFAEAGLNGQIIGLIDENGGVISVAAGGDTGGGGTGGGGEDLPGELTATLGTYSAYIVLNGAIGGAFDLGDYENPKITFTVSSPGFNDEGQAVTDTRTVFVKGLLRKPEPLENEFDITDNLDGSISVGVVLSDYIFAGDSVTVNAAAGWYTGQGAVTGQAIENLLTLQHFVPCGVWLQGDRELVSASTFTPKLLVGHYFGRNGRMVAAVKFILSDQSGNTVESLVNTVDVEAFGSGLNAEYYGKPISLATLAQGDLITKDAIIYPWIGQPFQLSVHGKPYPSPNLSIQKILNNKTGAYGVAYAYCDPLGDDALGVVSTNTATAAASPFRQYPAAAAAIQTFNNSNFGRNNVSGGVIRLNAGLYTPGSIAARAVGDVPLIIEAVESGAVVEVASSISNGFCDRIKIKGFEVKKVAAGSSVTFLDMSASVAAGLENFTCTSEGITWNLNGTSQSNSFVYRVGVMNQIGDVGSISQGNSFGGVAKLVNQVGCKNTGIGSAVYNAVACDTIGTQTGIVEGANMPRQFACVSAFNFIRQGVDGSKSINLDVPIDGGFIAFGNIYENFAGAVTGPAMFFYGDGNLNNVANIHSFHNTVVGSRTNFLYNETGSEAVTKIGTVKNSIHWQINSKADLFLHPTTGKNGGRVGNWGVVNHVGFENNTFLTGSAGGDVFAVGSWLGEMAGINEITGTDAVPLVSGFIDDRSGAGAGGGNYRLGESSQVSTVPSQKMMISHNLYGDILSGTVRAGACG